MKRILLLANPRSGQHGFSISMLDAFEHAWAVQGADVDVSFQFSRSVEDGRAKARRAVEEGIDVLVVAGGDGMVNTIGSVLVDTRVTLGVIPTGSGNGFARYFGIPLEWEAAAVALASGREHLIDVGEANGRPFFVTCSMAWDASLIQWFERFPMRGILPYVLSAAYEFFEYSPQPFEIDIDNHLNEPVFDPMVFTIANLDQYGGGARIAPTAKADDGKLELVVIRRKDMPRIGMNLQKLFDGTLHEMPDVQTRSFRRLRVRRQHAAPIQLDGELVPAPADVEVSIRPAALRILVPA